MNKFKKHIEKNKKAWNRRTPIHIESSFYNNKEFKQGKNSLKGIEINALGNIKGKKILHLQCHFGQDSISLARMGAEITAVDFSNVALTEAKKTAKETNTKVCFIESDVLTLNLNKKFDIVFTSYGVLGWLPDLKKWASVISSHLKKEGFFLLTEFHPFPPLLDDSQYDYFYKEAPDQEKKYGSYTDKGKKVLIEDCWWNHSLTEIFFAIESSGLKLLSFEEFDYSPFLLEGMIKREENKYVLKARASQKIPYVFNLKATKK